MTEEKKFLERPLAVLALVGGTLGVVATAIGIFRNLAGGAPPAPAGDGARVADCVRAHGLAQPSERLCTSWPLPVTAHYASAAIAPIAPNIPPMMSFTLLPARSESPGRPVM